MKRGFSRRIGTAVATLCFFVVLGTAGAANAASSPSSKMLAIAQAPDGHLTTDGYFALSPSASSSATIETDSCTGYRPELQPGDAVVVRDLSESRWTCKLLPPFTLLAAPNNVDSYTVTTYDDGKSRWSFKVPPIGAIDIDHSATVTPAVNDETDAMFVDVFPSQPVTVYIDFYTSSGKHTESFDAAPPFAQYRVKQQGYGYAVVSLRMPPCYVGQSNPLCGAPPPLYGLVTVRLRIKHGPDEPHFVPLVDDPDCDVDVDFLRDGRLVRVKRAIVFVDSFGVRWVTPAGTIADGATIPRLTWPIIGGPFEGAHRDGALSHDGAYATATETTILRAFLSPRRAQADRMFFEAMQVRGETPWIRDAIYRAVHHWGGFAWREDARRNETRRLLHPEWPRPGVKQ